MHRALIPYKAGMSEAPTHIRYATDASGQIATITLDRPEARNAYSDEMCAQLVAALERADADPQLRCVILTGEGKAFHAGGDIKAMRARSGMFAGDPVELRTRYMRGIHAVPRAIAEFSKPLIAAVNGAAIGAGLDLACMCDLRIAARGAKLGSTFVRVGLVPGDGGVYFLTRVVGFARALELVMSGRVLDADAALALGLVNDVVAPEELMSAAMARAQALAALPPAALQMTKRAAYRSYGADMNTALELAATYQGIVQNLPEHQAAIAPKPKG